MSSGATLALMAKKKAVAKNAAAVELGKRRAKKAKPGELSEIGRKGGEVGGAARADALSPKRRSEIAKKAAKARWAK
jgi:general stress protein YciG